MSGRDLHREFEAHLVALNRVAWLESVGLPHDRAESERLGAALAETAEQLMTDGGPSETRFGLEYWSEGRLQPLDRRLTDGLDRILTFEEFQVGGAALSWRNWRTFERQALSGGALSKAFDGFVAQSQELRPALEERYYRERENYRRLGLTKAHVYAGREGATVGELRGLLRRVGVACREPIQRWLREQGRSIFGYTLGPAELNALNNNRMYDLLSPRLRGVDALREAGRMYSRIGFDLSAIPTDLQDRPAKHAGAFCFPIAIPRDVRVSVKVASPHHFLDMLFHEFGHAVHFSGIDPGLTLMDRYWIHSGTHETYSTLFELLLGDPLFLQEHFGFDDELTAGMVAFDRFKAAWVGTYNAASALAGFDAWLEGLSWDQFEELYARYLLEFTGMEFPPGYARLNGFTRTVSIYTAGYVIAHVRCAHWLRGLQAEFGPRWWASPEAGRAIRGWIRPGGAVRFPREWLDPAPFLGQFAKG